MPAAQLASSGLERVFNQLLKLDPSSQDALKALADKQLEVKIEELPWILVFAFSQRVDVLVHSQYSEHFDADCRIALSLDTLQRLQDTSQLTALIQQEKLSLEGDIHVAQDFSALIKRINIDWEEQLSRFTGDVVAHSAFTFGKGILKHIKKTTDSIIDTVSDGAIEEKKLAAHPYAVEDYCAEVNKLRSGAERLEARLKNLENQK